MIDGRKVCRPDCPNRSAECRLTCEPYKAYRAEMLKEYEKRAQVYQGVPDSPLKQRLANRKAQDKLRGRK